MTEVVICSNCGKKFMLHEFEDNNFEPSECPGCKYEIVNVTPSKIGDGFLAWGKKKED